MIGNHLKITPTDIGFFLLGCSIYALIMWVVSLSVSGMMAFAFTTLVLGFAGLDLIFLLDMKWLMTTVAVDLILCALSAWYMMAHIIFLQLFGRDILPIGRPWINSKAALETTTIGEAAACGS